MEFIKVGKNYMIKGSNGRVVSEKEKLQLENNEMVIKDFESNKCQKETTKKISKNKKKIKKIEKEEKKLETPIEETEIIEDGTIEHPYTTIIPKKIEETALTEKEVDADDTIEETDNII